MGDIEDSHLKAEHTRLFLLYGDLSEKVRVPDRCFRWYAIRIGPGSSSSRCLIPAQNTAPI